MKSQPATTNVSPARTVKISRQPASCSATSSGAVAASAPSPPEVMIQPVSEACRSAGKLSEKALNAAIRQADTPRPLSPRPTASPKIPWPMAKVAAPAAAIRRSADSTRRARKRSSSMPSGMLSGGEGEEAGAGQQTQIAGTEFQLVGQYRSDDRVRRPLELGEEVGAGKGKEESQPQHRLRGSGDAGSRAAIERAADPPHRAAVPCWR